MIVSDETTLFLLFDGRLVCALKGLLLGQCLAVTIVRLTRSVVIGEVFPIRHVPPQQCQAVTLCERTR